MLWLATPAMKLEVLFVGQVYKVRDARMASNGGGGLGVPVQGGVWGFEFGSR